MQAAQNFSNRLKTWPGLHTQHQKICKPKVMTLYTLLELSPLKFCRHNVIGNNSLTCMSKSCNNVNILMSFWQIFFKGSFLILCAKPGYLLERPLDTTKKKKMSYNYSILPATPCKCIPFGRLVGRHLDSQRWQRRSPCWCPSWGPSSGAGPKWCHTPRIGGWVHLHTCLWGFCHRILHTQTPAGTHPNSEGALHISFVLTHIINTRYHYPVAI